MVVEVLSACVSSLGGARAVSSRKWGLPETEGAVETWREVCFVTDLLNVDDVVVRDGKLGADGRCVGCLVARHVVAVEDGRQARDVHGQDVEPAGSCRQGSVQQQSCGKGGVEAP